VNIWNFHDTNEIGGRGARFLAEVLGSLTGLHTLDISSDKIGDRGATCLAGVLRSLTLNSAWVDLVINIFHHYSVCTASGAASHTAVSTLAYLSNRLGDSSLIYQLDLRIVSFWNKTNTHTVQKLIHQTVSSKSKVHVQHCTLS
jgi:hypothetical protein